MPKALFFRLLETPIAQKGDHLQAQVAAWNAATPAAETYPAAPTDFSAIPGTPFAYWAHPSILDLFSSCSRLESEELHAISGTSTGDDYQFIRLFWEIAPSLIGQGKIWIDFPKGGTYSKFYSDPHLLINWTNNGALVSERGFIRNPGMYFNAGLTYPPRTQKGLNVRALPSGCVFSHKGPAILSSNGDKLELLALLSIVNSSIFEHLVKLQMAFGSFEVGVIQNTPIPLLSLSLKHELSSMSMDAYGLARQLSINDESTHVFCLPFLLSVSGNDLSVRLHNIALAESQRQAALAELQAKIDARVAELYGIDPGLLAKAPAPASDSGPALEDDGSSSVDEEEDEPETAPLQNPAAQISDLLMWCVGAAFGRWDARYALHPQTLPPLPDPFAPLPVCSPGQLQGANGLPLARPPAGYPLLVAPHGFLVDDPDRPADDIVAAVRRVLVLIWAGSAEAIEAEACQILGVPHLRAWFRDPQGFFAWHTKRYSKSRRKAPIYWLIQSRRKNYAIWLYYPQLNDDSLYFAAREYADAKLNLETSRLEDLESARAALTGASLKQHEKKIAVQAALVVELKEYIRALDAAALLDIKPDLNDGVLLNLAPLHQLVPWREPARIWSELLAGKYAWSHIAARLRHKKLVKGV